MSVQNRKQPKNRVPWVLNTGAPLIQILTKEPAKTPEMFQTHHRTSRVQPFLEKLSDICVPLPGLVCMFNLLPLATARLIGAEPPPSSALRHSTSSSLRNKRPDLASCRALRAALWFSALSRGSPKDTNPPRMPKTGGFSCWSVFERRLKSTLAHCQAHLRHV